jgi:hypothetical protein
MSLLSLSYGRLFFRLRNGNEILDGSHLGRCDGGRGGAPLMVALAVGRGTRGRGEEGGGGAEESDRTCKRWTLVGESSIERKSTAPRRNFQRSAGRFLTNERLGLTLLKRNDEWHEVAHAGAQGVTRRDKGREESMARREGSGKGQRRGWEGAGKGQGRGREGAGKCANSRNRRDIVVRGGAERKYSTPRA